MSTATDVIDPGAAECEIHPVNARGRRPAISGLGIPGRFTVYNSLACGHRSMLCAMAWRWTQVAEAA